MKDLSVEPSTVNLVKMDIEGAEIEVIESMIEEQFFPKQILVEFDELNVPTVKAFSRVTKIDTLLKKNGYKW